MTTAHTIDAATHGRYLVRTPDSPNPHALVVGFHGYAENAAIHLDALARTAASEPWLLVSVQALNRFYTRGDREVVASWMTREDRELAIADNIEYVRRVVVAVRDAYRTHAPLVYAGFSQGVAMAYRSALFGEPAQGLVVLAGDVPPDVAPHAERLPRTLVGRGRADDRYSSARLESDLAILSAAGVAVTTSEFDAGHVWHDDFALAGRRFLSELIGAVR